MDTAGQRLSCSPGATCSHTHITLVHAHDHARRVTLLSIRSLHLQLDINHTDAAVNRVLTTLAELPSLSQLQLGLAALRLPNSVELGLLADCRSLTDVELQAGFAAVQLSDTQIDQIRSSLGYLRRFSVRLQTPDDIARLLQPPVTARWQDIGFVIIGARTGELLVGLPSLTRLELTYMHDRSHVDFLTQLPHLTSFRLHCLKFARGWSIHADALLASLVRCSCITE